MKEDTARICRMLSRTNGPNDIVIVDYDGTLSDGRHRLHLLPKQDHHLTETWREFNAAANGDAAFRDVIETVNALSRAGKTIVILTGRSGEFRPEAVEWLNKNDVHFDFIIMRHQDDNRKDTVFKEEVLRAIGLEKIMCAFDDSPGVIRHFRALGITTFAVTEYEDAERHDLKSHGVDKIYEGQRDLIEKQIKEACQPGGAIYNMKMGINK